ncbi:MAG: DNA-binding transcriptional regulator [Pirellulales bacterium]|nr:DNA-binding transcriptional regulator [Pirellulales bacterium]
MAKTRQIALAFPSGPGHLQDLLHGITEYARNQIHWSMTGGPETFVMSTPELKGWPGDGVIAHIDTKRDVAIAKSLDIPVVNISAAIRDTGLPRVTNDHRAIGHAAAEHLLSRGLWQFAYYGLKNVWYSEERGTGFTERLEREGFDVPHWIATSSIEKKKGWHYWLGELRDWLEAVEPPIGILAVHDNRARMLVDVCRQMGLRVPHDIVVIGVNNDPMACEYAQPTLTSVARNNEQVGRKAAALLDRLMSGKRPPQRDILVAPGPVVERESTDLIAADNPNLSEAVCFIREHYAEGINVENVLEHVSLSRRWLEYRFQEYFGLTPHQFLCETRVEHAKQLLVNPIKMSVAAIARECGFTSARHLRLVFERIVGTTPREYRRTHQTS